MDVVVEGDRRRFSMLVEGVLDPDLYVAAMADFIFTITSTAEIGFRNGYISIEVKIINLIEVFFLY